MKEKKYKFLPLRGALTRGRSTHANNLPREEVPRKIVVYQGKPRTFRVSDADGGSGGEAP